ncbi:Pleckstrin-likey domain-containing family D member 1 [Hondaea fermentalgiana]|uniref:Pleckstrin-likey domain-containing family D member 1 n=1 Tax=Hondaea fermentalgiana TaxID=2315210 RepID=A0A2R5GIR5_9STRA|nr:Pleckstrin-likey domain-containing family D member 1 [Hondaea fermentalgiana]|eukprot:GBG28181.1 Pleckstrin-likey domain-containing family D member 1 [Hondaea fermentalgiana]
MRKSLSRTVGSKAQEMLGLGPNSKSRVLEVQRQGFLYKKPFSSNRRGQWQRRYFVLKDSFLLWYTSKPSSAFDMYPAGCLPLGGCSVFPMGREKDGGFVFEISHPDFDGNTLQLKSKDKAQVDDWIGVLEESSKATWQNAMLGDALIQKLKHAGTAAEKEREEALQEARRAAELMAEAREEKLRLMEAQFERHRKFEEDLQQERERAAALEDEVAEHEAHLLREQKEQERELQHAEELQQKLDDAVKAIAKLEAAVERRQRTDLPGMEPNPELQEHIETIKSFMNQRFGGASPGEEGQDDEDNDDDDEAAYDDEDDSPR